MTKPTTQEIQTEIQEVNNNHNQAQEIINQCKTRLIQIKAILDDRETSDTEQPT